MPRGHMAPLAEIRLLGGEHAVVVRSVRVVAGDAGVGHRRVLPAGDRALAQRLVIEAVLLVDDVPVARRADLDLVLRLQLLRALRLMNAVAREAAVAALIVLAAGEQR